LINDIGQKDLSSLIRDNIDELLVKIIQFTHIRHKVILENINNCHSAGFIPRQVDAEYFAKVISIALSEHQKNRRLVLCDSESVSFMPGGRLSVKLEVDAAARRLFEEDFDQYLCLQEQRLSENTINNKTACALLGHKLKLAKIAV
jgi:flagellar basal body rod protein FlgB